MLRRLYRYFVALCYSLFSFLFRIKRDRIVFCSGGYDGLHGNLYYLAKHAKAQGRLQVCVICSRPSKARRLLKDKQVETAYANSPRAAFMLATVKYLVTDSVFPAYVSKREGQVILNTWHGTPVKRMGFHVATALHEAEKLRKQFMMADVLLFQNDYSKMTMYEAYRLMDETKAVVMGSPRNEAFFRDRSAMRRLLGLDKKRVYAYMPTWRGANSNETDEEFMTELHGILKELDSFQCDDAVVFYKLHSFICKAKNMSFRFARLRPFPAELETYEFLSVVDCLITDYSSVIFDFVVTGREIVLLPFDEGRYERDRGLYIKLEDLPFERFYCVQELCKHISTDMAFTMTDEYERFRLKYCYSDSPDAAIKVMKHITDM